MDNANTALKLICPVCMEVDCIHHYTDAFAVRAIVGVNDDGTLKLSELDLKEFDDNYFECYNCGRRFEEDEIVELIEASREKQNA